MTATDTIVIPGGIALVALLAWYLFSPQRPIAQAAAGVQAGGAR